MDFPGGRNRHGIAQPLGEFAGVQRAEDAAGGVGVQITQICGQVEIPRSSPASPMVPFFTAFTVEGRMDPEAKGIRSAVSASVIP